MKHHFDGKEKKGSSTKDQHHKAQLTNAENKGKWKTSQ